ncbi:hypothetical protein DIZ76_010987 [Coccidioides immitis]|nr:hypothetical protein DIZ76_010987 [Coccidioides immitis]
MLEFQNALEENSAAGLMSLVPAIVERTKMLSIASSPQEFPLSFPENYARWIPILTSLKPRADKEDTLGFTRRVVIRGQR